jgi:hypothetical protein
MSEAAERQRQYLEQMHQRHPNMTRRQRIYLEHPDPYPLETTGPLLLESPTNWSSTASWEKFRDYVIRRAVELPDDPDLPNYRACAEAVLAWRATVAPEDWFWRED